MGSQLSLADVGLLLFVFILTMSGRDAARALTASSVALASFLELLAEGKV